MIKLKLKFNKIDQAALFKGKEDTYLDLVVWENKDGPGRFGDTHYVTQDLGKARRENGERSPIIGNGTEIRTARPLMQSRPAPAPTPQPPQTMTFLNPPPEDARPDDTENVPF